MAVNEVNLMNIPLQDILMERIASKLPIKKIYNLASTCRRLIHVLWDEVFWERIAHRDWGDIYETCVGMRNWRLFCLDMMSLKNMRWEEIPRHHGQWPQERWGHTMTTLDSHRILLFGGECESQCSDVYTLHCDTWEWTKEICSGIPPEMRFGHTCIHSDGQAIIFGGSRGAGYFNDLHCLDVNSWSWWQPRTSGTPPSPRSSHSATRVKHKIFIFGGIGSTSAGPNECLQDLVVLDTQNWAWSAPVVSGPKPAPRFVHRMVALAGQLLLFGGRTSGTDKFNDVHWLNPDTMTWSRPVVSGQLPSSRGGCSLVPVGDKALVFCGRAEGDVCLADGVHVLSGRGASMSWRCWNPRDAGPTARGAHGFSTVSCKVVVFGGYGPVPSAEASSLNDLWVLHMVHPDAVLPTDADKLPLSHRSLLPG